MKMLKGMTRCLLPVLKRGKKHTGIAMIVRAISQTVTEAWGPKQIRMIYQYLRKAMI